MPFQVFRRYQKTLLAVLAIFAMFAFVVADSLPRLFSNYARPMGGTTTRSSSSSTASRSAGAT